MWLIERSVIKISSVRQGTTVMWNGVEDFVSIDRYQIHGVYR